MHRWVEDPTSSPTPLSFEFEALVYAGTSLLTHAELRSGASLLLAGE